MVPHPQTDLPPRGFLRGVSTDSLLASREARWDGRHSCLYSAVNHQLCSTNRSYFQRWKDAPGYDLELPEELRGMARRWTTDGWKLDARPEGNYLERKASRPPPQENKRQKKQEKGWNSRHTVVYAKDNAKLNVNIRSYFDRSLEPFHPGRSSQPRQKLKPTWTLEKSSKPLSPPPSCRNLEPYDPEFDNPVTFSAGNDELTANLRDYFDRPRTREDPKHPAYDRHPQPGNVRIREHSVDGREHWRNGFGHSTGKPTEGNEILTREQWNELSPRKKPPLAISWREPQNQPTILRDGYVPGNWFKAAATDGTGMGVTFGEPIEALGHGMGTVTRETKEGKLRTAWYYPVEPPLRKKPPVGASPKKKFRSIDTLALSKSIGDISELV